MNLKPLVVYLSAHPLGKNHLKIFIDNYKKHKSGADHDLMICFKQFNDSNLLEWKKIIDIKYLEYVDNFELNDFDLGSYYRIAKKYDDRCILFLGTYSYPIVDNWLKIFIDNYENKSVLSASGSYASISGQHLSFFYKQHTKFQQLRWGLKHLIYVSLFPNPHLITTGFFIRAEDFLDLKVDLKKFIKKIETNYFESGRFGMSNQLISKGFKLYIVNSDNKKFSVKEWPKSETYCMGKQSKLIFSDIRTRVYDSLTETDRKKIQKSYWGKYI